MTMNDLIKAAAFAVLIEKFLCLLLGVRAVVVRDNLLAHKLAYIIPIIESVGASLICLYPYFSHFNPIELWWSQ